MLFNQNVLSKHILLSVYVLYLRDNCTNLFLIAFYFIISAPCLKGDMQKTTFIYSLYDKSGEFTRLGA